MPATPWWPNACPARPCIRWTLPWTRRLPPSALAFPPATGHAPVEVGIVGDRRVLDEITRTGKVQGVVLTEYGLVPIEYGIAEIVPRELLGAHFFQQVVCVVDVFHVPQHVAQVDLDRAGVGLVIVPIGNDRVQGAIECQADEFALAFRAAEPELPPVMSSVAR